MVALPHLANCAMGSLPELGAVRPGRNDDYLTRCDEQGGLSAPASRRRFRGRALPSCASPVTTAHRPFHRPGPPDAAWIARYAWSSRVDADGERRPSDYHKVLLKRLKKLEAELHERYGQFESRAYVDTGPVVERSLATAAGLGWTGKNTCLIHPQIGSFGFLAVLLTSLEADAARKPRQLTCPIAAEPARAASMPARRARLSAPYQMDATRCISYLTIEHEGRSSRTLMEGMGRQVFGCDICQDVCPWNRKAPIGADAELEPRDGTGQSCSGMAAS